MEGPGMAGHTYTRGRVEVFLETERLVLRRFTVDDVDRVVDGCRPGGDALHHGRHGHAAPGDRGRGAARLAAVLRAHARVRVRAAHERSTGDFIGWLHFRSPPDHVPDDVELGYRLRRAAWGKGYATEGARALIANGFRHQGVQRVFAFTMVVNLASRR